MLMMIWECVYVSDESLGGEEGLEGLVLVHFLEDVAAAHQFSVDVELGVGGPVAVDLHLFPHDGVVQHVDGLVLSQSYVHPLLPYFLSSSTTKLEYPQRGARGVPFMNSTTLLLFTHFSIISWAFSFVISVPLLSPPSPSDPEKRYTRAGLSLWRTKVFLNTLVSIHVYNYMWQSHQNNVFGNRGKNMRGVFGFEGWVGCVWICMDVYCGWVQVITNILYSQNYCMLDVYLALLPTYALVTIINLYYLKQSLNDHAIATAHTHHQLPTEPNELENTERSQFKACVTHLLKNFTLLEPCRVGRGKYKLSLLLTVSLVSIATFYINSPFSFVFLGVVVYSGYFLMALGSGKGEGEQKSQKQKYVQIAYAVTSVIINFTLIALLYKNYRNSLLRQFVTNCAINLAIDNFAVRPIALLLISLPLSRSSAVMGFIDSQEREVRVIEAFEKGSGKQLLQKPIGKMFSPTKIAKSVPLNMEIEPVPFLEPEQSDSSRWHRTLLTLKESAAQERLEKSLYILQQILGEETREKCFTLLRKITREESVERCLSILSAMVREEREEKSGYYLQQLKKHATPFKRHQHQEDLSMNSLFNSNNKEQETPRARHIELDESLHTSQHQIEITNEIPIQNKASTIEIDLPMPYMEHKPASDNVVMINPSRQEPQENEEDYVSLEQGRKITEESIEEQHLNFNKKETIELRQQINPLKIIVHESSGPSSRNEPLRICLNEAHMNGQDEEDQQQIESDRYRRRRSTINVQETSSKNTMGALQVKLSNRNQLEEIEEIDLNSPERRRKMAMKEEEASRVQVGKKKNKKRLSIDPRQRVIRFTTGQPYLQYLPNMLTSKDKKKKSQQFNKKELVIDSRMANSSKKQKKKEINFENNENLVPTFRIEEA